MSDIPTNFSKTVADASPDVTKGESIVFPETPVHGIEFDQILTSLKAIALAGGLSPLVMFIAFLIYGTITRQLPALSFQGIALGLCYTGTLGFVIGAVYSFVAGVFFAVLILLFHDATRLRFHPRTLCQLLGGMTGFWCVGFIVLADAESMDSGDFVSAMVMSLIGMAMGHTFTSLYYRRRFRDYVRAQNSSRPKQFKIWQMMVAMVWIAAFITALLLLPPLLAKLILIWLALQATLFLANAGINRLRRPAA